MKTMWAKEKTSDGAYRYCVLESQLSAENKEIQDYSRNIVYIDETFVNSSHHVPISELARTYFHQNIYYAT